MRKFKYTGNLWPGLVSNWSVIPKEISKPEYAADSIPWSELQADKIGKITKVLDPDKI